MNPGSVVHPYSTICLSSYQEFEISSLALWNMGFGQLRFSKESRLVLQRISNVILALTYCEELMFGAALADQFEQNRLSHCIQVIYK